MTNISYRTQTGLGSTPLPRSPKGGLRQSERKLGWLSDYSCGGDLRG